jgi:hypothetical protein
LAGDTLTIHSGYAFPTPNTFNLSHHAQASLDLRLSYASDNVANVSGRSTLDVSLGVSNRLTINLAAHANLFGNFDATRYSTLKISDAGEGTYHNNGMDTFSGATVTINSRVVGSGIFFVSYGPDAAPEVWNLAASFQGARQWTSWVAHICRILSGHPR